MRDRVTEDGCTLLLALGCMLDIWRQCLLLLLHGLLLLGCSDNIGLLLLFCLFGSKLRELLCLGFLLCNCAGELERIQSIMVHATAICSGVLTGLLDGQVDVVRQGSAHGNPYFLAQSSLSAARQYRSGRSNSALSRLVLRHRESRI